MNRLIIQIVLAVAIGCASTQKTFLDKKENVAIEYFRNACFGTCPVDHLTVYNTGKIAYEGKYHVKNTGRFSSRVHADTVLHLIKQAEQIGFFELDTLYKAMVADLPSYKLTITKGKKTHTVIDESYAPEEMRKTRKLLDDFINRLEFQSMAE